MKPYKVKPVMVFLHPHRFYALCMHCGCTIESRQPVTRPCCRACDGER